jgi:hypothetical protein
VPDLTLLSALQHVTGTLEVDTDVGSLHGLEALTTVDAGLTVHANVPNTDPLSSLASVGDSFSVYGGSAMTSVRVPKLTTAGAVLIEPQASSQPTITDVELPALQSTKWDFSIYDDSAVSGIVTLTAPALVTVGGNLGIEYLGLSSISAFGALQSVGGNLVISGLPSLAQLGGFGSLTQVGGSLSISFCPALTSIGGFQALTSAGSLGLSNLSSLTSFSGLASLATVGPPPPAAKITSASLYLDTLPKVTDLTGLKGLQASSQSVHVKGLDGLKSLAGLEALTTIGGDLYVTKNPSLVTLGGLDSVTSIGGLVAIQVNGSLKTIGSLNAVTTIGANGPAGEGGVKVEYDNALVTLDAFNGVTQMPNGASIAVDNDATLVALDAFGSLQTLGGQLFVSALPKLKTLAAFGSLTSAGSLDIESDPHLPTCQANAILTTLQAHGFTGKTTIQQDGPGTCP